MSLSLAIDNYIGRGLKAFHSPAHGGSENMRDLSELSGLDDLQSPESVLAEEQDFVAELFGAARSFFLINGASVGIQAAILSLPNDKPLLLARNVHKSVIAGLILSGHDIEWFEPEWVEDLATFGRFHLEDHINSRYAAVIITNPTYEGFYSSLPQLEIPIIVDEAHGAHYHFSDVLPAPALSAGADLVVQSWHKCLGSLGQTGVLHIAKNSKIAADTVQDRLRLLQSTSPSYLLLESITKCAHTLASEGCARFARAITLRKLFDQLCHPHTIRASKLNDDPLRLNIRFDKNISGETLLDLFEQEGIALEKAGHSSVLAFINYSNTEEDIQALYQAYKKVEDLIQGLEEISPATKPTWTEQICSPRSAVFAKNSDMVITTLEAPCPPGIAIKVPGQKREIV